MAVNAIASDKEWRLSMSGYSIKTGWANDSRIGFGSCFIDLSFMAISS